MKEYTIRSGRTEAVILSYGAMIKTFSVDGRNCVLTLEEYDTVEKTNGFFSQVVGPFANRIRNASFVMDGVRYDVERNRGAHSIHSGARNFGKHEWSLCEQSEDSVTLTLHSPESSGFPGNIDVSLKYTVTEDGNLELLYTMTSDKKTPVNVTNHVYFTLEETDSRNVRIMIPADSYVDTDSEGIPKGIVSVDGTDFDLRKPIRTGDKRDGYFDHCFMLNENSTIVAESPSMTLTCTTDLPGVQFYTASSMHRTEKSPDGRTLGPFSGFALETEFCPDFPNCPDLKGKYLLPGEVWQTKTTYNLKLK